MKRLAIATIFGLVLGACGGDDPDDSTTPPSDEVAAATSTEPGSSSPSSAPTSGASAPSSIAATGPSGSDAPATTGGPITIEHVYGETVLDDVPERIVSLNVQWTDVLTELGRPPVAATIDPTQDGWFPWQHADGVEPIEVPADSSTPFEVIATYDPDLIVGSWSIADDATYRTLSAIAPTIPLLGGREVDPWEDLATVAGTFLDQPELAASLVADADQAAADVLADLPALEGKTYALANYVPGDQIYVVADPDDGASRLFGKLGMHIDPDLLALDDAGFGRIQLSFERIGELDADVLLILTNGTDTDDILGFDALPAVQSGAVSVLEFAPVVGINTPTPLSVPYSLEFIRPALEAAAAS